MRSTWQRFVQRADALAADGGASSSLVTFYAALLRAQQTLRDHLSTLTDGRPSGSLERDLNAWRAALPTLLRSIADAAPEPLRGEARHRLAAGRAGLDEELLAFWQSPSDRQFFAKVAMQPYMDWLIACGVTRPDREIARAENRCPFCGGLPQLSVLHAAPETDGGGRSLQCAACLTMWPFRRVLCAHCGEEDERALGYFHSAAFEHLRIDACDSCGHYLKSVDLTRLGTAVPLVDEVAGAPLDLWAREHGYTKIELNLIGL